MEKIRLLIFSEYPIVRSGLRHLLSSGQEIDIVGEADSLQKAELAVQRLCPDVILVETFESSATVVPPIAEKIGRTAKVPIVVLSTDENARFVRAMLRAGVTGYVLKQSSEVELLSALRSAARGRKFLDPALIDALAFDGGTWARKSAHKHRLSKREIEVVRLLVQGYTGPQVARALHVSVKTVETYRSRIYEKLELQSRADLVRYAITVGLISVHDRFLERL